MSATDTEPQNKPSRTALEEMADDGRIFALFEDYLRFCRSESECGSSKNAGRIPNIAGFCRFADSTLSEFDRLKKTRPELHGALCAAFEDEALNSAMPPSILSIYLKLRLGYSGESAEETGITDSGQIRLIFDHDAYRDGE